MIVGMLQQAVGECCGIILVGHEVPGRRRQNHFVGPNTLASGKKKTEKRDKEGNSIKTCLRHFETESAQSIYGAWVGPGMREIDKSSGVFSEKTQRQGSLVARILY